MTPCPAVTSVRRLELGVYGASVGMVMFPGCGIGMLLFSSAVICMFRGFLGACGILDCIRISRGT